MGSGEITCLWSRSWLSCYTSLFPSRFLLHHFLYKSPTRQFFSQKLLLGVWPKPVNLQANQGTCGRHALACCGYNWPQSLNWRVCVNPDRSFALECWSVSGGMGSGGTWNQELKEKDTRGLVTLFEPLAGPALWACSLCSPIGLWA